MRIRSALDLLDPGALQAGALFRSFVADLDDLHLAPGTRLGAYRICGELGAGGMGVVYAAERADGEFEQSVAIKLAEAGSASDETFARERQILAALNHPHIVRLLDGGRSEGRAWFAMERIDGVPIDQHARERSLSVEARIRLLLQVVDAVAFAHRQLLVHRDLKPANVLVDAAGQVKLLDFGIAALTGDGAASQAYSPRWASPEQRAGDVVGTASDVYQLGLLLDALLGPAQRDGGRGPQPQCWTMAPGRRREELAAIVQRACAAGVHERHASAAGLGEELQRWLEQRPVPSFGHGWTYALRCAIARRPWVAAGSAIALALVVAGSSAFMLALRAERDRARQAAAHAEREARAARAVAAFLQDDVLAMADPNVSQDADLRVAELLQRAAPAVSARFAERPDLAVEILTTVARGLRGLDRLEAAAQVYAQAAQLAAHLPAAAPQRAELALREGELALAASHPDAASLKLREALALAPAGTRQALDAAVYLQVAAFDHGDQAGATAALQALAPEVDRVLGREHPLAIHVQNRIAIQLNALERLPDALAAREEHLRRCTSAYGAQHSATLTGRVNLAALLRKAGRLAEAEAEVSQAEQGLRAVYGDPSVPLLHAMNVRGRILTDLKRHDEAIALQRQTLAGRVALLGEEHDDVAYSYINLAGTLMVAGRLDEARGAAAAALAVREKLYGPEHIDVITNLTVLADIERHLGNIEGAEVRARAAAERAERALGADRIERASALFRLAQVLEARGLRDEARETARRALAVYARLPQPPPERVAAMQALIES